MALLAVIVLPMVMDREPRPPSQDIQVRIPSQDSTGLAAKVLPGKPAATPMPAPVPKAAPPSSAAETKVDAPAKPEPVTPVVPVTASPVAVTPEPKSAEKPAVPEKTIEAAAKPAADAAAKWVVQLGAYKESGNVKILMAKLKGLGIPAYTEKFDSPQGPRTRVRAGPFVSQEAAEKARARVKIIGVDGPVAPK